MISINNGTALDSMKDQDYQWSGIMNSVPIGGRIGAILKSNTDTVHFIGFGVFTGYKTPPKDVGGMNIGMPNPKFEMDDGSIVWGCECWWGLEAKIQSMIANKTIILVDMDKERNKVSNE